VFADSPDELDLDELQATKIVRAGTLGRSMLRPHVILFLFLSLMTAKKREGGAGDCRFNPELVSTYKP